jgi:hypothetical protein
MCTNCHNQVMKTSRDEISQVEHQYVEPQKRIESMETVSGGCRCNCARCDTGEHCGKKANGCYFYG